MPTTSRRSRIAVALVGSAIALFSAAGAASADVESGITGANVDGKVVLTYTNGTDKLSGCVAWLWPADKKASLDEYLHVIETEQRDPDWDEYMGDPIATRSVGVEAGQSVKASPWIYDEGEVVTLTELPAGEYVGIGACGDTGSSWHDFVVTGNADTGGGEDGDDDGAEDGSGTGFGSLENLLP